MRRLIFLSLLFVTGFCFAQEIPRKIYGGIPDERDTRMYQIQVGAYERPENTDNAIQRLQRNGLHPVRQAHVTQWNENVTRVMITGIPASQVRNFLVVVARAGFTDEVIVRVDTSGSAPTIISTPTPVQPSANPFPTQAQSSPFPATPSSAPAQSLAPASNPFPSSSSYNPPVQSSAPPASSFPVTPSSAPASSNPFQTTTAPVAPASSSFQTTTAPAPASSSTPAPAFSGQTLPQQAATTTPAQPSASSQSAVPVTSPSAPDPLTFEEQTILQQSQQATPPEEANTGYEFEALDTNNFGTYQEPDMSESVSASGERPTVTREGFITLTIDDAKVNSDTSE